MVLFPNFSLSGVATFLWSARAEILSDRKNLNGEEVVNVSNVIHMSASLHWLRMKIEEVLKSFMALLKWFLALC